MKIEDKYLLLKDLCARLPYGVFAWYRSTCGMIKGYEEAEFTIIVDSVDINRQLISYRPYYGAERSISSISVLGSRMFNRKNEVLVKPYLRPLSSMTDDEEYDLEGWGDWELISWLGNEEVCFCDMAVKYETLFKLLDWFNPLKILIFLEE